jgi:hypothetical protein
VTAPWSSAASGARTHSLGASEPALIASSLLAELTLEEKASLCLGSDFWHTAAVPRLGIAAVTMADGPHGLPAGSELLHELVGTEGAGRPRGILGDDELRAVIGNFPISLLAAFPGSALDSGTVEELLRRWRSSGTR